MPKRSMEILTEAMFYVLLALQNGDKCGSDIAAFVTRRTVGRVSLGPATLYTLLSKFEKEDYIRTVAEEGRKRTYSLTGTGYDAFLQELDRLRACVADAEKGVDC